MNYKIDNCAEIYNSLVDNFKMTTDGKRASIVKAAKQMKTELGKKRDSVTKEYQVVLDKIIKDYSKKQTLEDIQKEIDEAKWGKKR